MLDEVLPHGFLQRRDVQAEDVRHVVPLVHMLRNEGTHKAVVTARVRGVLCDEEQTEDACPCVKGGGEVGGRRKRAHRRKCGGASTRYLRTLDSRRGILLGLSPQRLVQLQALVSNEPGQVGKVRRGRRRFEVRDQAVVVH